MGDSPWQEGPWALDQEKRGVPVEELQKRPSRKNWGGRPGECGVPGLQGGECLEKGKGEAVYYYECSHLVTDMEVLEFHESSLGQW